MEALRVLWERARQPRLGFAARAAQAPGLREAVGGLLAARTGPAFLSLLLSYLGFALLYGRISHLQGPLFDYLWANLPESVNPEEVRAAFLGLPALPSWTRVVPWLILLAPLGVLSLWLHDAVWDHTCLWLLRGLKARKSLRLTLVADAEALKVGALGAALGLLADIPGLGCLLGGLLLPVGVYFWIMRGYALAAWHGCPVWKGVLATLLHALLAALFAGIILGLFLVLVVQAVRG